MLVLAFEHDPRRPVDRHADALQREAALFVGRRLFAALCDDRIDERTRAFLVRLVDEHAAEDPDLGGCEPDALRVVHQRDHALDETAKVVVELLDVVRLQAERGIAVLADLRECELLSRVGFGTRLRVLVGLGLVEVLVIVVVLVVVVVGHSGASVVTRQGTREDPLRVGGGRPAMDYKLCGSTSTTAVSPARRIAGAAAESRCAACDAIRRGCVVFATS